MEHAKELVIKVCSIPGQCIVVDKATNGDKFSLQMSNKYAVDIVNRYNSHDALLVACENVMASIEELGQVEDTDIALVVEIKQAITSAEAN